MTGAHSHLRRLNYYERVRIVGSMRRLSHKLPLLEPETADVRLGFDATAAA